MSNFKGTSGKWHIRDNEASITDDKGKSVVCWQGVATSTFWKDETELKANSKLISKAPEMLEMLEHIYQNGQLCIGLEIRLEQLIKEAKEL
jgi:hypothetical protein